MPSGSSQRVILWGVRLAIVGVILRYAYLSYRYGGVKNLLIFSCVSAASFFLPSALRQGEELAEANMRKYGLEPDREEAQPACKAIDN